MVDVFTLNIPIASDGMRQVAERDYCVLLDVPDSVELIINRLPWRPNQTRTTNFPATFVVFVPQRGSGALDAALLQKLMQPQPLVVIPF